MTTKPTLTEIAARIDTHLKRFEADPKINKRDPKYGGRTYYYAGASRAGRFVRVWYITYQGGDDLKRTDAERYLAMLDGGFVGRHFEALRQQTPIRGEAV